MASPTGANAVIIEEISGQKRRLELRGPGLPHRGVAWKTELRMNTTWYPGNAQEATQQVLGPIELPSDWEGFWRLTMLNRCPCKYSEGGGTPTDIVQPVTLRDICDGMFRGGGRLRVSWIVSTVYTSSSGTRTTGEHNVIREGRCKSWEFPHDRVEDIGWKFQFEWQSRGGEMQKAIDTRDDTFESAYAKFSAAGENALRAISDAKIRSIKSGLKGSASSLTLGQLQALAGAPQALVDSFGRQVQKQLTTLQELTTFVNTVRSMPYALANSAVGIARNVVTVCNQTSASLSRTPPEAHTMTNNVNDLTRNACYLGGVVIETQGLARVAQAIETSSMLALSKLNARGAGNSNRTNQNTTQRTTLGVHIVRDGDTPLSISMKWYQSPNHAADLLRANRMPIDTVRLQVGKPLVVPSLSSVAGM